MASFVATSFLVSLLSLAAESSTGLKNPGFETGLEGWTTHVYGAPSRVETDSQIVHGGRRSLRISAAKPSDTALGQEITVPPGRWYRLCGWVRTRGLDPQGAPVAGTFQVQQPAGSGVLASGLNHTGDTEWTEVVVPFRAPADGRIRLAIFFVGYGKGTGTAWFDDLKLETFDPGTSPIIITRDFLTPARISPFQYGQFIEYLCDLVPGMWAEKLFDGSFEGLSPYKFTFLAQTDFRERPWYPSGAVNRADYVSDPQDPVSGRVSQKIAAGGVTPCTIGLSQDGIAVERGQACRLSCFLRQKGLTGAVEIRLHHEGRLLGSGSFRPSEAWQKFQARLVPADSCSAATLSISFRGPGTLWLDNISLMPENTVGGWRCDVVEALRALKPGIIRWGGSVVEEPSFGDLNWRDTLGNSDRRRPFHAWGGLQPTGPGLEEIVQLCRQVGAEPLLCVPFSHHKPQDAADMVQYFNGAPESPLGQLRARNGHPEPYRIRYWQVGNERAGREYEAGLAAFFRAMKKADPTIKLLSSYPTPGVMKQAGSLLDYVCPHHYGCANLAAMNGDLAAIRSLLAREAPGRPIRVAVTEWNTTAGDWGPRRAMLWTLENALACARYHNLMHRHCDLVEIANRSNLTNSFCSGIIQTDRRRLYGTPTYYAQQLYATLAGDRPLRITSDVPADLAPDLSATLSSTGDLVTALAVNPETEDLTRTLDLSAFGTGGREITVWTLTDRKKAGEPDVTNSFADPERISPVFSRFPAPAGRFVYRFPALSLTVLRWKVVRIANN